MLTLPNLLTLSRILAVPILVFLLAISMTITAATMILSAIGSRNCPSLEMRPCARARYPSK